MSHVMSIGFYNYKAKIVNVVDGDTVDVAVSVGFLLTATLRLRLLGVNAPEMHGSTRDAGRAARAFVESNLLGKDVVIHTEKGDAFGRWLSVIYLDGELFNQRLIDEGHAVPFMTAEKSLRKDDSDRRCEGGIASVE